MSHNWVLRQLDSTNSFLNGTLYEIVYMAQPPGYVDARFPNYVCQLRKAIYGLKQAPQVWNDTLKSVLLFGLSPIASLISLCSSIIMTFSCCLLCVSREYTCLMVIRKQTAVARSSTESEYRVLAHAFAEISGLFVSGPLV
ncbi:uncharacterized protein LOC111021295 [Momordica charantia]|uniref:Uncharacterized protein LOC111021295 n=1 Tax=Momordica charantia TaxID=3673 RepID=A0A6J1DK60_MOMCH|nr:uncharacterized protein LOC111021295 [Momordica charantia]